MRTNLRQQDFDAEGAQRSTSHLPPRGMTESSRGTQNRGVESPANTQKGMPVTDEDTVVTTESPIVETHEVFGFPRERIPDTPYFFELESKKKCGDFNKEREAQDSRNGILLQKDRVKAIWIGRGQNHRVWERSSWSAMPDNPYNPPFSFWRHGVLIADFEVGEYRFRDRTVWREVLDILNTQFFSFKATQYKRLRLEQKRKRKRLPTPRFGYNIIGYSDCVGGKRRNERLRRARAREVNKGLNSISGGLWVDPNKLKVRGADYKRYLFMNDNETNRAYNRSVLIEIIIFDQVSVAPGGPR